MLTMLDLKWPINPNRGHLEAAVEWLPGAFGVIPPTAGTVLDMDRTLTHKTIVVEMSLEGLSTLSRSPDAFTIRRRR